MRARAPLLLDWRRAGYLYIWHLVKIEGCCYSSSPSSSFHWFILLSLSIEWLRSRTRERYSFSNTWTLVYLLLACLISSSLSPLLFFNPNTTAAILESGVYPSFFFFSLYACERTHILHHPVFCSFWWYTMGDEGKNCVCVFTTSRYETKTDIRKEMGSLSLSRFFYVFPELSIPGIPKR